MKYLFIQIMLLPIKNLWQSENIKILYKIILTPILIAWIPIGFFVAILTIFIFFPSVKLYFKLRMWNKKRKRKKNYWKT